MTIEIEDQNDNKPQFDFPIIRKNLMENVPINSLVTKLSANDADIQASNKNFVYKLVGAADKNSLDKFTVTLDGLLYFC